IARRTDPAVDSATADRIDHAAFRLALQLVPALPHFGIAAGINFEDFGRADYFLGILVDFFAPATALVVKFQLAPNPFDARQQIPCCNGQRGNFVSSSAAWPAWPSSVNASSFMALASFCCAGVAPAARHCDLFHAGSHIPPSVTSQSGPRIAIRAASSASALVLKGPCSCST